MAFFHPLILSASSSSCSARTSANLIFPPERPPLPAKKAPGLSPHEPELLEKQHLPLSQEITPENSALADDNDDHDDHDHDSAPESAPTSAIEGRPVSTDV